MVRPRDIIDIDRLAMAVNESRLQLNWPRTQFVEMVKQDAGAHWQQDASPVEVPFNFISLYRQIILRSLIAKNPRYLLSTFDKSMKSAVSIMEQALNKRIEEMGFCETLQDVVTSALFVMGILKISLATPGEAAGTTWHTQAGEVCAAEVLFDDYVFDTHGRNFNNCSFEGHRYRVLLDVVKDSKLYGAARKDLEREDDAIYNPEGGDERISALQRGILKGGTQEFMDYVTLWEIWCPHYNKVVTLTDNQVTGAASMAPRTRKDGTREFAWRGEALREQKWIGPKTGPYHKLALIKIPGAALPKGPIQDIYPFHLSINNGWRKLRRQAVAQKRVTLVQANHQEDGQRLMKASDGEMIPVADPNAFVVNEGAAINQGLFQTVQAMEMVLNKIAGNLDLMGGMGAQSKTATQDKMLNANASATVTDMQDKVLDFARQAGDAICWYLWHDPFATHEVHHTLPGMPEVSIKRSLPPQQRQRPYSDIQFKIDTYSIQRSTPQSRQQDLDGLVQQVIMPMQALLQQQGIMFDISKYLEKMGKYKDMPDLQELLTIQEPPQESQGGGQDQPPVKPAQTRRDYVRHSSPGVGGQQSQQAALANSLNAAWADQPSGQGGGQ